MSDFQVSQRSIRRGAMAGMVLVASVCTTAALAQTAPLSYAVPDSTAWSDILKSNKAPMGRAKTTTERKKSTTAPRQAKARPAVKTVAPDEINELDRAADVSVVRPDELNEIDRMAGQ